MHLIETERKSAQLVPVHFKEAFDLVSWIFLYSNSKIKGFKINNYVHHIPQFADDTTLILNGSKTILLLWKFLEICQDL